MRTRRIIWLLAALLSLGSLQAAPATRIAPCAEVRGYTSLVVAQSEPDSVARTLPAAVYGEEPQASRAFPERVETTTGWLESRSRFQRPPPFEI